MPGWVDGGGLKLMLAQPGWISDSYPINKDVVLKRTGINLYVLNIADEQSRWQFTALFPNGTMKTVQGGHCDALFFRP